MTTYLKLHNIEMLNLGKWNKRTSGSRNYRVRTIVIKDENRHITEITLYEKETSGKQQLTGNKVRTINKGVGK